MVSHSTWRALRVSWPTSTFPLVQLRVPCTAAQTGVQVRLVPAALNHATAFGKAATLPRQLCVRSFLGRAGGPHAEGRPLSDIKVGESLVGTVVQIYLPSGISVDVGCADSFAFLELEEFQDSFPKGGPFSFKPGDELTARVLDVDPNAEVDDRAEPDPSSEHGDSGKLHLTLRTGDLSRPPRYVADVNRPANLEPFLKLSPDEWFDGVVVRMASWAVFVKLRLASGDEFVGILYETEFIGDFADRVVRGSQVRIRIKEADVECRRLLLTMKNT